MTSKRHALFILVVTIAAGLFAGVTGAVWSGNYLERYAASLQSAGERVLTLSEQKPTPLPGTYEEAVAQVSAVATPAVARFYRGNAESYLPGALTSLGVVVTSDGWILTALETVELDVPLRVFIGEQAYTVIDYATDPATDTAMVQVAGSNLPVIPFGASDAVGAGDLLFAAVGESGLLPTALVDPRHFIGNEAANPAEQFVIDFAYSDTLTTPGTPMTNTLGQLVAMETTPLHQIIPFVKAVIRSGVNSRPYFGATVIDLAAVQIDTELSQGLHRGAYVTAVASSSPAALAGVKKGDIILSVNSVVLNDSTTLTEQVLAYSPGDNLSINVLRAGEELSLTVQLILK